MNTKLYVDVNHSSLLVVKVAVQTDIEVLLFVVILRLPDEFGQRLDGYLGGTHKRKFTLMQNVKLVVLLLGKLSMNILIGDGITEMLDIHIILVAGKPSILLHNKVEIGNMLHL